MSQASGKDRAARTWGSAVVAGCAGAWLAMVCLAAAPIPPGYLTPAQLPDSARVLGPPPPDGSGTKAGDVATYLATRRLEGTPRWSLAARDATFGPEAMMGDFSCALGVRLDPTSAPALFRLLSRMVADSEAIDRSAKDSYKRVRPFVEQGGTICVQPEDWLKATYSYPSGHSTFGWTTGLVLAAISPDRATELLARARSYGESRVVCGVHYQSDVQAGRMAASALFGALQASPDFKADLDRAGREMRRLRAAPASALDPAECRMEAEAADKPVW